MNRKIRISTVLAIIAMAMALTFVVTFLYVRDQFNSQLKDRSALDSEMAKYVQVREYIDSSFVGKYTEEELIDGAIDGMIDGLGDRWSHYLSREAYENYEETVNNKYMGIGAVIESEDTKSGLRIMKTYPDSPAAEAGITGGDTIIAVDGKPISEMNFADAKGAIRGEAGTSIKLTIRKANGSELEISVTRRAVNVPVVSQEMLAGNIGLVTIENFDGNAAVEFEKAVNSLIASGATRLIFDVRNNPGGQLSELLDILDTLLPEGKTFISRDKAGNEKTYDSDADCINLPMAVLVNADSYSAAEFFAAALQEYDWAKIVGVQTFGKGYSQIPIKLSDGSAIVLSTNEYFTPKGVSLIGTGITPDYVVELSDEDQSSLSADKLPNAEDEQLQQAIAAVLEQMAPSASS